MNWCCGFHCVDCGVSDEKKRHVEEPGLADSIIMLIRCFQSVGYVNTANQKPKQGNLFESKTDIFETKAQHSGVSEVLDTC